MNPNNPTVTLLDYIDIWLALEGLEGQLADRPFEEMQECSFASLGVDDERLLDILAALSVLTGRIISEKLLDARLTPAYVVGQIAAIHQTHFPVFECHLVSINPALLVTAQAVLRKYLAQTPEDQRIPLRGDMTLGELGLGPVSIEEILLDIEDALKPTDATGKALLSYTEPGLTSLPVDITTTIHELMEAVMTELARHQKNAEDAEAYFAEHKYYA